MYIFYFLYCWLRKLLYCYLPVERAPCQGTAGSLQVRPAVLHPQGTECWQQPRVGWKKILSLR